MKKVNAFKLGFRFLGVLFILSLILMPLGAFAEKSERYIVVFKEGSNAERAQTVTRSGGIAIDDVPSIKGTVAHLTSQAKKDLEKQAKVKHIEKDLLYQAINRVNAKGKGTQTSPPPQVTPWGITQISADSAWTTSRGTGVKVAVLDTGIAVKHPDLRVSGGIDTINYQSYDDKNGHGSHVAGIIGALDNSIGVVGVAPEADLLAVKVLNNAGSGYTSDIIEGIDWAISRNARVINMSLGGTGYSSLFQDAINRANAAGVVVVAAAGNSGSSGNPVTYPAAYDNVVAVAATDSSNARAYFSNYGSYVDIAAPGVSVYSTYKGSGYASLSGTSMASPHVAGAAALVAHVRPSDSTADALTNVLTSNITDLGVPGWDPYYGYGLVNVLSAVSAP